MLCINIEEEKNTDSHQMQMSDTDTDTQLVYKHSTRIRSCLTVGTFTFPSKAFICFSLFLINGERTQICVLPACLSHEVFIFYT